MFAKKTQMDKLMDNLPLIIAGVGAVGLVIFFFAALMLRRVVPTNMVHTVQTGKSTTSYGRGRPSGNVYYEWPSWFPKIGVTVMRMPESVFEVTLKDYEAYDSARLPFMVDVTSFFRIANSETAAQRTSSFEELKVQLEQVVQGAVRRVLATNALEEIMHQRSTLGQQFTEEVDKGVEEWGAQTVKMVEFMDIRDSKNQKSTVIHDIMAKDQARISQESRVKVAEHNRIATLAEIVAKQEIDTKDEEAKQIVGIREAQRLQEVGIAKEKSNQSVEQEKKATKMNEMAVFEVETTRKAEIAKKAAEIRADQDKNVAVVLANQSSEVAIVNAEGEKKATETRAEGELFASLKKAEGVKANGIAEGEAEKAKLMAPVEAQIALANKIENSEVYQKYLIDNRQVEANEEVGKAMAAALQKADIKIIGGSGGSVPGQAKNIMDMFTTNGGVDLAGMLTGFASTEEGNALLGKLLLKEDKNKG